MCPHSKVVLDCGAQDAPRLLHGECAALAEDVDERRQLKLRGGGNHVLADNADVLLGIIAVFRRDHVRSQQRGNHRAWPLVRCLANRLERLHLSCKAQTVTGLRFDGRRTLCGHFVEGASHLLRELSPLANPEHREGWREFRPLLRRFLRTMRPRCASRNQSGEAW